LESWGSGVVDWDFALPLIRPSGTFSP
jgi:hypothetical protein